MATLFTQIRLPKTAFPKTHHPFQSQETGLNFNAYQVSFARKKSLTNFTYMNNPARTQGEGCRVRSLLSPPPLSWVKYVKIMNCFSRNRFYTPNFGRKINKLNIYPVWKIHWIRPCNPLSYDFINVNKRFYSGFHMKCKDLKVCDPMYRYHIDGLEEETFLHLVLEPFHFVKRPLRNKFCQVKLTCTSYCNDYAYA